MCCKVECCMYIYRRFVLISECHAEFNACLCAEVSGEEGGHWRYIFKDSASTCFVKLPVSTSFRYSYMAALLIGKLI